MTRGVLVAGCSGFLGTALTRRLEGDGWSVVGVSRRTGVDLACREQVEALGDSDVIVNVAGRTSVPASYDDPEGFARDNVLVTQNLLALARRSGARFVHAGSYVYGMPRVLPIDEAQPLAAHNPYAASKLRAEQACAEACRDLGVPVTVLRIFNVYGPGQRSGFVVPAILEGIRAGTIEIADPTPRRDFVHLDDVVDALARAIARPLHGGYEAINVGSGRSTSVAELIEIALRASARDVRVRIKNTPRHDEIADVVADVRKASTMLGWRPRIDLESGIARLVASSEGSA